MRDKMGREWRDPRSVGERWHVSDQRGWQRQPDGNTSSACADVDAVPKPEREGGQMNLPLRGPSYKSKICHSLQSWTGRTNHMSRQDGSFGPEQSNYGFMGMQSPSAGTFHSFFHPDFPCMIPAADITFGGRSEPGRYPHCGRDPRLSCRYLGT